MPPRPVQLISVERAVRNMARYNEGILTNILARLEFCVLLAWENTESVCTEVVALRLQYIGWENFTSISIEEGKGCAESGNRDTPEHCLSAHTSPTRLGFVHGYNIRSSQRTS